MKTIILILALFLSFCSFAYNKNIEWISSTELKPWFNENTITFNDSATEDSEIIEIYPDSCYQIIIGFGGCFNELSWEALKLLPEMQRENIFKELFSTEGANFNYNRLPIGASDYSLDFYSYNEVKNDFEMKSFSINRDKHCLIPYIKNAQKYAPNMKFFASPWCPPSWMKVNENYASKPNEKYNELAPEFETETGTTGFKMLKGHLNAYALYFSKYLDAYKNEGIVINDLHVQNEVLAKQIFPSCLWQPQDIAHFIGEYLGPRFEQEGRKVNIWLGTLNVADIKYVQTCMNNVDAAKYIKGLGLQWAGKKMIARAHKEYPQLHIIQTENECGGGQNNWKSAEYTWSLIKHYMNNGAEAYIYWNFILQSPGISHWGWVQNSMITINKITGQVIYNPEFYVMKHLSHYVQSGAKLLKTSGDFTNLLVFKNSDNSLIIIVNNDENEEKQILLKIEGKYLSILLKADSFNTLVME